MSTRHWKDVGLPPKIPLRAPDALKILLNFALSCDVNGGRAPNTTPEEGPATGSEETGEMFSKTASGPAAAQDQHCMRHAENGYSRRLTNASATAVPFCAYPINRKATPTPCLSNRPSLLSTLAISHILASASGGRLDALNIRVAVCGLIFPVRSESPMVKTHSIRGASSVDA